MTQDSILSGCYDYSLDERKVISFIEKYNVKFWGFTDTDFTPEYLENNRWLRQFQPVTQDAANSLKLGQIPVLINLKNSCTAFQMQGFSLLSTDCIKNSFEKRV